MVISYQFGACSAQLKGGFVVGIVVVVVGAAHLQERFEDM